MARQTAPADDELRTAFAAVPVNRALGFRLVSASAEVAEVALDPTPDIAQEHGVIHGGLLATLADTAAVYLIHPGLRDGERMASIEFKVNFIQAAWPDRGPLVARARPVRIGRRVAVCHAEVFQDDQLLLTGLFTYMKFTPGS